MMEATNRHILVACFEVPGFGGASTMAYQLFARMQGDGLRVSFLNIIGDRDEAYLRYTYGERMGNPDGLTDVYSIVVSPHPLHPEASASGLTDLVARLDPDVILGIDFIASSIMGRVAQTKKLIFLVVGCDLAIEALRLGLARDLVSFLRMNDGRTPLPLSHRHERAVVMRSDMIMPVADFLHKTLSDAYPAQKGKISRSTIWASEWICERAREYARLARPFSDREIDVLFVASVWSRPVKNYRMVRQIIRRCRDLNIHVVGQASPRIAGATYHGLVTSREALFGLMGNAKTVVSTSLVDVAPGVLFEASEMGCNVVASRNCGNWQICHADLLVESFSAAAFEAAILKAIRGKFSDNLPWFQNQHSYEVLLDTLAVI